MMNKKILTLMFVLLVLFLLACRLTTQSPLLVRPSNTEQVSNNQTTPSLPNTPPSHPTDESSQTPSQPVFDSATIGNISELNSYVLSTQDQYTYTTKDGTTTEGNVQAIGEYVKEPKRYHITRDWKDNATPNGHMDYFWIDNKIFNLATAVSWYITFDSAKLNQDFVQGVQDDIDFTELSLLKDARLVGQEDFQGISCYHFTFDQTNYTAEVLQYLTSMQAQGNIYLAKNGNYPIHYDEKSTRIYTSGTKLVQEVSKDLASINQLKEIALSADIPQVNPPDIPLPNGAELVYATHSYGITTYKYASTLSVEETKAFYKTLSSSSGWNFAGAYVFAGTEIIDIKKGDDELEVTVSYDDNWEMTSFDVRPPLP